MTDTTKHLRELLRKAGEATPGPWGVIRCDEYQTAFHIQNDDWDFCDTDADAAYIAAASPEVVAALARFAGETIAALDIHARLAPSAAACVEVISDTADELDAALAAARGDDS